MYKRALQILRVRWHSPRCSSDDRPRTYRFRTTSGAISNRMNETGGLANPSELSRILTDCWMSWNRMALIAWLRPGLIERKSKLPDPTRGVTICDEQGGCVGINRDCTGTSGAPPFGGLAKSLVPGLGSKSASPTGSGMQCGRSCRWLIGFPDRSS